jgi:hypothetical protein
VIRLVIQLPRNDLPEAAFADAKGLASDYDRWALGLLQDHGADLAVTAIPGLARLGLLPVY